MKDVNKEEIRNTTTGYKDLFPGYEDVLKPEDVQKILHIGRNAVYNHLKNGHIRSIMISGKYRIPKLYLADFLYQDIHNNNQEDDDHGQTYEK